MNQQHPVPSMSGKVALVTGGSSGIGRAAAIAYANAGAKVVVSARREAEGQETVDIIRKAGGEASFVRADVTNEMDVEALVGAVLTGHGRLDAAFNNAGVEGTFGPLSDAAEATYRHVFDANVLGVLLSMKHETRAMLRTGGGAIVNNASIAAHVGFPGAAIYAASKHAVVGLTRSAALEYGPSGVRVNAVSPAAVQTDMLDRAFPTREAKAQMAALHPIGRIGSVEEIAAGVVFLSSPATSFVTGQALVIDGGFTAQ